MTDSGEDGPEHDKAPSQHIPKPWVIPVPKGTLQRIFGTSQIFQNFDDIKPKATGLTVPLKVREYYHRAHQCLEQEDWEMAVLFFSRALHLDPQLVEFYALRAEAYIQLCDFSSAAQNLRKAYHSQPENSNYLERLALVLYLKGQCLFEQCAFLDALTVFSQASELQPEKFCFRYRCMACLLALKKHRECLSFVTKEVKQGTTNADVYILRARLYNFFQKPNLCYRDLHSALLLDPKHPQAKVLLQVMVGQAEQARQDARVLAVQGKLQHALQCINCAIENNPLDPSFFLFRGTMYRRLQDFDLAVEDFLKALDMMSDHQEELVQQAQRQLLLAYNDFAVHCYMQGAYQESVLLLNKALKDEQQEKGLYINRGGLDWALEGPEGGREGEEAEEESQCPTETLYCGAGRGTLFERPPGYIVLQNAQIRQFQKAENHFSMAIQHNPQKPQYYLYRARSRQLMQNIFGARQDVATVLLLDPKQPKLLPLMANLFPGMSVEEVLSSQVANLARLQLERVVEHSMYTRAPQDILGQLKDREQRARAVILSWKLEPPLLETPKEMETPLQFPQAKPEGPEEEVQVPGKKEKLKPAPSKESSLTDSYISQTSLGSILGFRTRSTSETETSSTGQEYRSTSTTVVTVSDSSLLRTQSSDSGDSRKDLSLNHSPRETKSTPGHHQRPSKTEAALIHSQRPSKTDTSQIQSQRPSKTDTAQIQSQRPSKMDATQIQSQRPSKTDTTQIQSQRPSKMDATQIRSQRPSKTDTAQIQSQRPSKMEASLIHSQRPSKTDTTQIQSQRPSRMEATLIHSQRPSRTEATLIHSQRPSRTDATQIQNQRPSRTEAAWSPRQKLNKTQATQGSRRRLRKSKGADGQSWRLRKAAATQDQSWRMIQSPSKINTSYDSSWSPSNTEATKGQAQSQRPSQSKAAQSASPGSSKTEVTWGLNPSLSNMQTAQGPRQKPSPSSEAAL
ncbi:PREDICTED: tetratricopeptide repeat protein 16 [Bison bison bison]|uniref:Tetratricopeptide repeat protein 16 n=1 Tax=Bison bison bison TaxID=43346 RepID=A0A6P3IVW7_BISBB|nr:PREDICTED: tetratricopeptide repeat protein 16 [Bison bison bison]